MKAESNSTGADRAEKLWQALALLAGASAIVADHEDVPDPDNFVNVDRLLREAMVHVKDVAEQEASLPAGGAIETGTRKEAANG